MRNRAVVTGIGLLTPLGAGAAGFFDAVCAGRSGLRRPAHTHPVAGILDAAGFAPRVDPATVLPPAEARRVDRFVVLAMAAADAALADAGVAVGREVDPARTAVVLANAFGGLGMFEAEALARQSAGHTAVSPYLLAGMLPNMATARIAIRHGVRGYSSTISTACASGAYAVAEALRLVRDGLADVVVCGGAEAPLLPTAATTFRNSRALAGGWADPAEASRPFDRRRNGFVLGEGAGVLVVERAEHAAARGRPGYAEVAGWGVATDAYHPTAPRDDGTGAAAAMRLALADAGLAPAEVGYVNAHGTGTKLGDAAEARAIRAVFGAHAPAVSSVKGVTGHPLAAAGAVEAAATVLALHRGVLPPTHNLDDPDPECDLDHVRKAPREVAAGAALSNSFAFGGHNVSLAFTHPPSAAVEAPPRS
ncbi:beta-ketoacyl-[acyl-carrier-protein] synthase family protein [Phytohabitans sp. ZYX-F-186]|uniref:Beta-ketoacyl-[acyl-carrier-protein] synthase family protein n=1 Tax=Phytohabitans maris TaxID=3071409 RepID=A0ABU0ZV12_9ACTN|nr:beta-ketoacyl-[acyl-carrier-protein] synthase family protein [Phytohabitans sp. ZYX-F-186]MDQ7910878.1 beta-ketoacyl-[acyl-carrier-protein] synthase family protein [Phytohabitans sp. ZYX-F-186]